MKRFIFWSTVLLALSGTMMGMAQENNVVIFDGDGGQEYIYKKKHKYYVLKEDGIADVASDLFKKNKRWAKKILKKAVRNKNNAVDIFELVEGAYFEPYAGYSFKNQYISEYEYGYNDHDLPLEKHALRIQLPIELFTYENVWKLYEYIMDRIDIPDTPPYKARFYEPEIREVLNAPLE